MNNDITSLTSQELTHPDFIKTIYDVYHEDKNELALVIEEVRSKARECGVVNTVEKAIAKQEAIQSSNFVVSTTNVVELLETAQNGKALETTNNYVLIMNNDENLRGTFVYDEFSGKILKPQSGMSAWSDVDDSALRVYIESTYGLYNQSKYYDAFNNVLQERSFHPIKRVIEQEPWDGIPRIDKFLHSILKCPDNDYHREVSRMIFYGGISRLYKPGCKFDYMPILMGLQGSGKSTIIKWLALGDKYFTEINTIEGKEALEQLQGSWICEFAELLAMVRSKDVEGMKGFISRTTDRYRQAYGRRLSEFPRQCIFIGTTNDYNFLVDKTGNRRYLPIEMGLNVGELFEREAYIKDYIMKCWREALVLFNNGATYLTIPAKYHNIVKQAQDAVMQDDPKTGLIEEYLSNKKVGDKVCGIEIFTKCMNGIRKNYSLNDSKEMSRHMSYHSNWKRCKNVVRFADYGPQRAWEKVAPNEEGDDLD